MYRYAIENISASLLRYRFWALTIILVLTLFLGSHVGRIKFAYEEVNLLPDNHPETVDYDKFSALFGDEARTIFVGIKEERLFEPKNLKAWQRLSDSLMRFNAVESAFGISTIPILSKNKAKKRFELQTISANNDESSAILKFKNYLTDSLPFYRGLLFNEAKTTYLAVFFLDNDIVNTKKRSEFILQHFIPLIQAFEAETGIEIHTSGMPYIRTLNSKNIRTEMVYFVLFTMITTALIFFFFFQSIRATLITISVVIIGVTWCFGLIGWLGYEITILTALIPPLIIVIAVPNAIFIINKFQHEIKKGFNKQKAIKNTIKKVGNATLMTNFTTAIGFATFIFTKSDFMKEFGLIAFISIISVFFVSIVVIPVVYSFMPPPKLRHLKHLNKRWIKRIIKKMAHIVRYHRQKVYVGSLLVLILSGIGFYQIKVSGSLLDDMPKERDFFQDVLFFDKHFGGIMPIEILIDTGRKNGVLRHENLKKIDQLQQSLDSLNNISRSFSLVNSLKYGRQTFYKGNPRYYKLPTRRERSFLMPYFRNTQNLSLGQNFVDKTGQYARVSAQMKDLDTDKIKGLKSHLAHLLHKIFPDKNYKTTITGKSMMFLTGTHFLIQNLVVSLSLAILIIAILMGFLFRSVKMVVISLIPNLLPLLITAGFMGYIGIPIKPSTILVFSIAFGISVDDTIHFLAKYRQELSIHKHKIKRAVYMAISETGVSMFYTSVVLFFGFMTLTISDFGGTRALGVLTSFTLLFAMGTNLILLPTLLLSFEKGVKKKRLKTG